MNDFKRLMTARFFFTLAVRMQAVILGWQMYVLTKDALQLGLIGLAEAIPALSIAIYAGYVVDRSRPLRVFAFVQWGSLLSAAVVLASVIPRVGLDVHAQVAALYLASFITGAARGFSQPAMYAIVPRLMARAELSRASAWMSSTMQMASILGPAIGGMLFAWGGVAVASAFPVAFLGVSLGAQALIQAKIDPPLQKSPGHIRDELFSGALFVWRHPILLPALTLDMVSVLFGGVTALLPIFADEVLHIGATGLGILRAGPAVGSMIGSILLTRLDIRREAGPWLLGAVFGFGLCMLTFGLSHSFVLSLFVLTLSGAFDSVSVIVRSSAVQLASPEHMRGRISAVNSIFIGSSNELGEFESGVAARFLGTVPSVVLGSVLCLLTVMTLGLRSRQLRTLDLTQLERN